MPQLRQHGYRMDAKEDVRQHALKKVMKQTGTAPVISKLVQLRTYRKHASPRSKEGRHKKILTRDIEFVQHTRNAMTERQRTLDKKKTKIYRASKGDI